jgi:RNA polymerase sigma-70 factor (ECF subfamily)
LQVNTSVTPSSQAESGREDWVQVLTTGTSQREMALEELRSFLLRGLQRSLTHRYGGQVDVEDVVQQALVKILDSLDSFRGQSRFTTWAMSIAVRLGISQMRRHYYRDVSLDLHDSEGHAKLELSVGQEPPSDKAASRTSVLLLLQSLIETVLTDRQRVAVRGILEGLPVEEIAVRMESNRNAVYKLVHDARLRLREGFEARGVTMEDVLETIS